MRDKPPQIVHLAAGREWRGGERQVLLLARELAKNGTTQTVITRAESRLARELGALGLPVHGVRWHAALSGAAFAAAWRAGRRAPTLFHAHDGHAVTLAVAAGWLTRRPVVLTRRTAFPVRRPSMWRRASHVIAVSEAVRAVLLEAGVAPSRITIVPSGIDVAAARATHPGLVRAELGLPADAPLLVNVAAFTREKDHDTLLRAAAALAPRLPELHWVLAGDGPLRHQLTRLARDLGLGERIHFVGWLDDPLPLIAAAHVFVLSSSMEGMGTVLLDAMALGVPIVATAAGGIPEAVGEAALLVPARTPAALAQAIVRAASEPSVRDELRKAAARQSERATAGGMAAKVGDVYRSIGLTH